MYQVYIIVYRFESDTVELCNIRLMVGQSIIKKETLVRIQLNGNLNKINLTMLNILIMLNKRESTILFQWFLHLEVRIIPISGIHVGSNPTETSKACELPKSFKSSSLDLFRANFKLLHPVGSMHSLWFNSAMELPY